MSSPARRRELAAVREVEYEARVAEDWRKANLSMWERIEEAELSGDLKDILHRLAQQTGLEE